MRSIAFAVPPVRTLNVDYGVALQSARRCDAADLERRTVPWRFLASEGRGRVRSPSASLGPFVNAGIGPRRQRPPRLALTGLAGRVGPDEYHHGRGRPRLHRAARSDPARPRPPRRSGWVFVYWRLTGGGSRAAAAAASIRGRRDPAPAEYVRRLRFRARPVGALSEIARRRLRDDLRRELAWQAGLDPRDRLRPRRERDRCPEPVRAAEAPRLHVAPPVDCATTRSCVPRTTWRGSSARRRRRERRSRRTGETFRAQVHRIVIGQEETVTISVPRAVPSADTRS